MPLVYEGRGRSGARGMPPFSQPLQHGGRLAHGHWCALTLPSPRQLPPSPRQAPPAPAEGAEAFFGDMLRAEEQDCGARVRVLCARGRERVEWRLQNLVEDKKLYRVTYAGLVLERGKSIASPRFRLCGHEATLRFWPNGHSSGKREACCAVGLHMPRGTKLRLRFFAGALTSAPRDCYWEDTCTLQQLWTPETAPCLTDLVVGVEVVTAPRVALQLPELFQKSRGDQHDHPVNDSARKPRSA